MPYNNQYNQNVAQAVRGYSQQHINRENTINDFTTNYEIPSQVESAVMRYPEVHGGSGFAAATVQDLGFEPTMGATSADGAPARVKKKVIEVGEGLSAAGVSAAGMSAAGVCAAGTSLAGLRAPSRATPSAGSAAAKPKKATRKTLQVPIPDAPVAEGVSAGKRPRKKKGGALLSLKDLDAMKGQPPDTIRATVAPTSRPEAAAAAAALGSGAVGEGMVGGLRRRRIEIVKEVMKKHKLSLPAASKYVKEHKLY